MALAGDKERHGICPIPSKGRGRCHPFHPSPRPHLLPTLPFPMGLPLSPSSPSRPSPRSVLRLIIITE